MVCVHQGTEADAEEFFATWGGASFGRIADPTRRLYAAFDLKRASLRQAFGFPMWRRGIDASQRGFVLGRVAGDAWQMPGCFVLHKGRILSSFPYDMVSDRPDYLAFVEDALDASQQLKLLPDGQLVEPLGVSVLAPWQALAQMPEVLLSLTEPVRLEQLAHALLAQQRQTGRLLRSDAARLALASHAGIRTPAGYFLPPQLSIDALSRFLGTLPKAQWFQATGAGDPRHASWDAGDEPLVGTPEALRTGLRQRLDQLLTQASGGVLLLHAPDPTEAGWIQGVARVRPLMIALELWEARGGRSDAAPLELTLSLLGATWTSIPSQLPGGLSSLQLRDGLVPLLRRAWRHVGDPVLEAHWQFHLEDGFRLTRVRGLDASVRLRRLLSTAVVRELSPPIPSPLFVDGLETAGKRIQASLECLDPGLSAVSEPLVVRENGRVFLNADLLGYLMQRWGISSAWLGRWLGGGLPVQPASPARWLRMLPMALKRLFSRSDWSAQNRSTLIALHARLLKAESRQALLDWYASAMSALADSWLRLLLAEALALPGGGFLAKRSGQDAASREPVEVRKTRGHRGLFEADPAWPRGDHPETCGEPRALLPDPLEGLTGWQRLLAGRAGVKAHRDWVWDSGLRLLAAFRARLLASMKPAVEAGLLDDAESCWALGMAELLRPESDWGMLMRLPRRAPIQEPPPLFFLGEEEGVEALDAPVYVLRAGQAEGRAVVASLPAQALKQLRSLKAPAILVVPALGPGWEGVLPRVVGVVAGLGGRLSMLSDLEALPPGAPVILNAAAWVRGVQAGAPVRITQAGGLEAAFASHEPLPLEIHPDARCVR